MSKRTGIVLPETTIQPADRMTRQLPRYDFTEQAARFVTRSTTEPLRARLERAAVRDRDLDRRICADRRSI
jgi:hypothetical protein